MRRRKRKALRQCFDVKVMRGAGFVNPRQPAGAAQTLKKPDCCGHATVAPGDGGENAKALRFGVDP